VVESVSASSSFVAGGEGELARGWEKGSSGERGGVWITTRFFFFALVVGVVGATAYTEQSATTFQSIAAGQIVWLFLERFVSYTVQCLYLAHYYCARSRPAACFPGIGGMDCQTSQWPSPARVGG